MWQQNQIVVHQGAGVCRITGLSTCGHPPRPCYLLSPLYDANSTLYIPIDGENNPLRDVISREAAISLVNELPQLEDLHFSTLMEKKNHAAEILNSGDLYQVAQLAKTIYDSQNQSQSSKNTHITDRGILRQAERILFGELAVSLGLGLDDVADYISGQLDPAT